jgi:hypothetical protein
VPVVTVFGVLVFGMALVNVKIWRVQGVGSRVESLGYRVSPVALVNVKI